MKTCEVLWGPSINRFGIRWDHGMLSMQWRFRLRVVEKRERPLDMRALHIMDVREEFNGVLEDKLIYI